MYRHQQPVQVITLVYPGTHDHRAEKTRESHSKW